jgi:putative nucleotidyltransferase with HDIG domain
MIPSTEECVKFMDMYGMLDHIREHSIVVEKIACLIAQGLKEAGANVSIHVIKAGALMHDIGKTPCLNSREDHAAKGKEICLQNNLDEIADIVDEHVTLKTGLDDGVITEKEIVYYADKRVKHDKVVSLKEREEYILERYAKGRDDLRILIIKNFNLCKEVEKKIFSRLHFGPEQLAEMIR